MKTSYLDMIVEAVHVLGERKGSSAQAIWKHINVKHSLSVREQKIFRVQLKRVAGAAKYVEKSGAASFKLTSGFRGKLLRWAAKASGSEKNLPPMAMGRAVTAEVKNLRKAAARTKKAAMSKSRKGKKALAKSMKKAAAKMKALSTKAQAAAKKKTQRKTASKPKTGGKKKAAAGKAKAGSPAEGKKSIGVSQLGGSAKKSPSVSRKSKGIKK